MTESFQSVRGMSDILPEEALRWEWLEGELRAWASAYAYEPIRMPLVEFTGLFRRTIGEGTDIVDKEMFSFPLGEDHYTLRPEGTASCVRAVLQHRLTYGTSKRLWYLGPMFRHERPQKNRYRQFHQMGIEAFGYPQLEMELEHLLMVARLWRRLGISGVRLEINTLGSFDERERHRKKLVAFFSAHEDAMSEDERRRIHTNPLRLLDSKNPQLASIVHAAPRLMDEMETTSLDRFSKLQQSLKTLQIPFTVNPTMVRGLDYYSHTVYEWICDKLGPQGTVCAGGRYDKLPEVLGSVNLPACGFAIGLERTLQLCEQPLPSAPNHVYLAHQGEGSEVIALQLAENLRERTIKVEMHCGSGGFKQQLKRAAESGAKVTLILGEEEMATNQVTVRDMLSRSQQLVERQKIAEYLSHFF